MPRDLSDYFVGADFLAAADHRLKLYSAAAIAAGVGVLALAQPADAEVVITKKNLPITMGAFAPVPVLIDLNHDGISDFQFSLYTFAYHSFDADLTVTALNGGRVVGQPGSRGSYASALVRGSKIGPSAHFSSRGEAIIERSHGLFRSSHSSETRHTYGKWSGDSPNRYLGVKFLIQGATHYGWVRLTVNSTREAITATITAYAYETIPNKRVQVGVASAAASGTQAELTKSTGHPSLGMLALGAAGLAAWKREESFPC
jgi:hypothetical protein